MEFKIMIQADNSVKVMPFTSRNATANFILERDRQTIGNIIHIFKVQNMVLNNEKPSGRFSIHHICTAYNSAHCNVAYLSSISARMGFNIEHTSQSKLAVNSQT